VADYRRRYRDRAYAPAADQRALTAAVAAMVARHGGTPAERDDPAHLTGQAPATPVTLRPGTAAPTADAGAHADTQLSLL
jgi:hypothetical protein